MARKKKTDEDDYDVCRELVACQESANAIAVRLLSHESYKKPGVLCLEACIAVQEAASFARLAALALTRAELAQAKSLTAFHNGAKT